ncbi:prolyl-tRNA synthetase associated domain-containing protein [Alphaproteobacteria bacterium LSUCC0684]
MSAIAASPEADASSEFEDSLPTSSVQMMGILDDLGISYTLHTHPPLRTVEDSRALRGDIDGAHIKNLYLRDGKKKNFLVVAEESRPIDLKELGIAIGGSRLSFGSPDRLMEFLGVRPGAVSPLTLINDTARDVTLIFDESLDQAEMINVHPLVNDKTLSLSTPGLRQFLEHTGHWAGRIVI